MAAAPDVEVLSPLTPSECMRRLREATGTWWAAKGRTVLGAFEVGTAVLRQGQPVRNNIYSGLRVEFVEAGDGSRMICRYGLRASSRVMIWFGCILWTLGLVRWIASGTFDGWTGQVIAGLFMWIVFLCGFLIVASLVSMMAREERAALIMFLSVTTEGEVALPPR